MLKSLGCFVLQIKTFLKCVVTSGSNMIVLCLKTYAVVTVAWSFGGSERIGLN